MNCVMIHQMLQATAYKRTDETITLAKKVAEVRLKDFEANRKKKDSGRFSSQVDQEGEGSIRQYLPTKEVLAKNIPKWSMI